MINKDINGRTDRDSVSNLEFHLLSLLGVGRLDVLVMAQSVSSVLLLCGHITLQSLKHTVRLCVCV